MPTTITSAGITFNDATSLTSANIGTAQLVNGSVTAAKLGTTEQRQIAKAWVNFNGVQITANPAPNGSSVAVTSGSNQGTWNFTGAFSSQHLGLIYFLNIEGSNATLGGVNVSTAGIQINNIISANQATFTLLAGPAISSQTVNGNGSSTGFSYSTSGIRSSYNVSSITKNGTGDYTINFTTAMADANYTVFGIGGNIGTTAITAAWTLSPASNGLTASSVRIYSQYGAGNVAYDPVIAFIQVFGN